MLTIGPVVMSMFKRSRSPVVAVAAVLALASAAPAVAQQKRDPLTRFIDGFFRKDAAGEPATAPAPAPAPTAAEPAPQPDKAAPAVAEAAPRKSSHPLPPPRPVFAADEAPPQQAVASADPAVVIPSPSAAAEAVPAASASAAPQALLPPPAGRPAPRQVASAAATAPVPDSPDAALDRLNAHFNSIDQMTATFVQRAQNGSVQEGTLALKRPGQFRFNYAPPSTLEIVSDGRSVAIRDKKLGTNDVYPVGQTPLKFLVQDKFNLARDTKVQDVRTSPDGTVTVIFEDRATLGGTSKIELRFDARANRLKQWVVTDPQGFRTTVVLSDVNVVRSASQ